jgi:hypothetical protein
MPVAIKSSGGGSVTIAAASTASDFTATLQSATGTIPVVTPGTSGNVLTSDGTNWTSAAAPVIDVQTFNTSGTWTKPAGYAAASRVYVQMWGGGASGTRNSSTVEAATGGGGGAYSSAWFALSSFGATETITIGAGGASRTGSNQTGAAGGNTSVGSLLTAGGGLGGVALTTTSGSGGNLVGTFFSEIPGATGRGVVGVPGGSIFAAGAGGGGVGYDGSTSAEVGGVSRLGGNGGNGSLTTATAGTAPGGGGGGARSTTSGAGGDGRVIITVFPS